jgi:hypothetical protein
MSEPAPLTPAMEAGLLDFLHGPVVRQGPRDMDPSRWTWRAATGATISQQTLSGLIRRRLVRLAREAPPVLTPPGRKEAERLALQRAADTSSNPNRKAS